MERLLELGGARVGSGVAGPTDARLHYLEAGSGPPLVLLQGASGGAANWYRLLAPLAQQFHVLAPDLPGFGLSPPTSASAPLGRSAAYALRAWFRATGVARCDLVGTSFGGLVALRLAHETPELVRRLVLLNAVGLGRELPAAVRLAALPLLGRAALRPSRRVSAWLFRKLLTGGRRRLAAAEEAALLDYLWCCALAGDPSWMAGALRLFARPLGQREVMTSRELADVRCSVLVLWGECDPFLPLAHGQRAASLIPRALLHLLRDVGHSPNWEAPDETLALVLPFLTAPDVC